LTPLLLVIIAEAAIPTGPLELFSPLLVRVPVTVILPEPLAFFSPLPLRDAGVLILPVPLTEDELNPSPVKIPREGIILVP
jgi:hypothetical protein